MRIENFLLVAILSLLCSDLFAQGKDIIRWKDSNRAPIEECTVKKETFSKILFTMKGSTAIQEDDMTKVQEVVFGTRPFRLDSAEGAEKKGDFKEALNFYKKLADDVKNKQADAKDKQANDNYMQYSIFGEARCLIALKEYDSTIKTLNGLKTNIPETKFLKELYLNLYDCYMKKGDQQSAEKTLSDFKNDSIQKSMGGWESEITVIEAGLAEAKGDYQTAYRKYITIQQQKGKVTSEAARESAITGEVRALSMLKDYTKLGRRCKGLLDDQSPLILAYAYAYLGEAALQEKDYKNAMELSLHTILLYRDSDPKVTAKAYYVAVTAMAQLASSQSDQGEKDKYKERAETLCNELASYNQSLYAKAKETLDKIK